MLSKSGFIAIAWGTTNRRVFVLDADGAVVDCFTDGAGVVSILPEEFPAVVEQLRERCGDRPMLLAGMIGSNRGWVEAPYLDCPTTIDALGQALVPLEGQNAWIVPGVCDRARPEVMRGEEVQLLGAAATGLIPTDGPACNPGTHAKWARIEAGAITSFRTLMTGEMFAVLRQHSILAGPLTGEIAPGAAFREGVMTALERRELLADLFSIRARTLLGTLAPEDTAAFGSGLLVGSDIAIGLDFIGDASPVALIGDAHLTELYACALSLAGRESQQICGEEAFLAGIRALAARI